MGFVRRVLEKASRGRSLWRRLPAPFSDAKILLTPDSALSLLKAGDSWCDPELLKMAREHVKPGDTVWDVGANVGIFGAAAAVASGAAGRVLCIEPDVELIRLLRRTAARLSSQCARMDTLAVAVADVPGIASFQIALRGRASNALSEFKGRSQMGGTRETQLVPVVRLDDVLKISPSPAFVKIDVEGAESVIFNGAHQLLTQVRPVIYVEVSEENAAEVFRQLSTAEYDLFDPAIPLAEQKPRSACTWNTLAIPRSSR
jgi:FkbM family methyltransferase